MACGREGAGVMSVGVRGYSSGHIAKEQERGCRTLSISQSLGRVAAIGARGRQAAAGRAIVA